MKKRFGCLLGIKITKSFFQRAGGVIELQKLEFQRMVLITETGVPNNGGGLNYRNWSFKEWWWFEFQTLEFKECMVVV